MPHENVNDLIAFLAVARERSFTKQAEERNVAVGLSDTKGI